mmetsp:Transcript_28041/g.70454  ORF Transcript_28041/g.70454 Transcript_28041/m.70454 type:complete len:241 (+) Transcript_28041:1410-2132(+)
MSRALAARELHRPLGHQLPRRRIHAVGKDAVQPEVNHKVHTPRVRFRHAAVRVRPPLTELPVLLAGGLCLLHVARLGLHQNRARAPWPPISGEVQHGDLRVPVVDRHHPLLGLAEVEVTRAAAARLDARLLHQAVVRGHAQGDDLPLVVDALGGGVQQTRVGGAPHDERDVGTDGIGGEVREAAVGAAEVQDVDATLGAVARRRGVRQKLGVVVRPDQHDAVLGVWRVGLLRVDRRGDAR